METLPPELLVRIWKTLPCEDLINVMSVCRTFFETVNNNSVWMNSAFNSGFIKYINYDTTGIDEMSDRDELPKILPRDLLLDVIENNELCCNLRGYLKFRLHENEILASNPVENLYIFERNSSFILLINEKYFCCSLEYGFLPADIMLAVWNIETTPLFCGSICISVDAKTEVKIENDVLFLINSMIVCIFQLPSVQDLENDNLDSLTMSRMCNQHKIKPIIKSSLKPKHILQETCSCSTYKYLYVCSDLTISAFNVSRKERKDYYLPSLNGYPPNIIINKIIECYCYSSSVVLKVQASETFIVLFFLKVEPLMYICNYIPNLTVNSPIVFDRDSFMYVHYLSEQSKEIMLYSTSSFIRSLKKTAENYIVSNQGILCILNSTTYCLVTCKGKELIFLFDEIFSGMHTLILSKNIIILSKICILGLKNGLILIFSYCPAKNMYIQAKAISVKHTLEQINYYDGRICALGSRNQMLCYSVFSFK